MLMTGFRTLTRPLDWLEGQLARLLPYDVAALMLRIAIAGVFWRSGRTKVDGVLTLKESTVWLFEDDYALPLLPPEVAAHLATWAEHLFPVLLVLGLFTRSAALALLGMTLIIQLFVYPDAWWPVHSLWVGMLAVLIASGPGRLSADGLLARI